MPLVLTRRLDEAVMIGNDVTVRIIGIKGGQVRLALTAPDDVKILREELVGQPDPKGEV